MKRKMLKSRDCPGGKTPSFGSETYDNKIELNIAYFHFIFFNLLKIREEEKENVKSFKKYPICEL